MKNFFSIVGSFLAHFFATEVEAVTPTVKQIVDELPADITASKPLVQLGHTLVAAGPALEAAGITAGEGAILSAAASAIGSKQSS